MPSKQIYQEVKPMNKFYDKFKTDLIPVKLKLNADNKKDAIFKPWKRGEVYLDKDFKGYNSVAMRTGKSTYNVIDVDTKDTTQLTEPWCTWIEDRLMFGDATIVETTNGYHFYFKSDFKLRTVNKIDAHGVKVPFIDFRGEGGVVFVSSKTDFANYNILATDVTNVEELAGLLPVFIESEQHREGGYDEDMHDLSVAIKANEGLNDEEVKALFKTIPTSFTDGDDWLRIGMGLYDRFEGDDTGLKIWTDYCKRCYSENPNNEWAGSLDRDIAKWEQGYLIPDKITYKHLLNYSAELVGNNLTNKIKNAKSDSELQNVIKDISKISKLHGRKTPDNEVREKLAEKVNARYKGLKAEGTFTSRVPQTRAIIKEMEYIPDESDMEQAAEDSGWLNNIVFVESFKTAKYYLILTSEKLSAEGVNGRFCSELNQLRKEMKLKTLTIQALVKMGMVKVCSNHEYNPTHETQVFKDPNGGTILNTYKTGTRPTPATEYTKRGEELINIFLRHFEIIMSKKESKIFLDWLAWTAQNFGKKVLWTPLIQSEEGIGKSVIGNVMINHVFGEANAGTVDSTVIVSPQTSWATQGVFKVLEEIKLAGHNRFEVLNQLKPFITNHTVSRVEKYEASSEVRNFVNFIAFTNFKDALPITKGDRRWWVVYSRLKSLEQLEAEVGMGRNKYFAPLHELANPECKHGAEFHKYLLERDVNDFEPNFASESKHKASMVATEDSKTPYLTELENVIEDTYRGVTPEVLSTRQLKELMTSERWEYGDIKFTPSEIGALLRRMGYTKFSKRVELEKVRHNVWFNNAGWNDDEVKKAFKDAMELSGEGIVDEFDDLDIKDL